MVVDQIAAVYILQGYLNSLGNNIMWLVKNQNKYFNCFLRNLILNAERTKIKAYAFNSFRNMFRKNRNKY
jgi:hypothetical protein